MLSTVTVLLRPVAACEPVGRATFRVRLRVDSEAALFCPICIQDLPWRHLGGVSNFRQEAKGTSKIAGGAVNQNYSFDCKWRPPI